METKITNFYSIPFVRIDTLNNPEARLIMVKKLLEGYKWYLGFGNALGFHRDGDLIPNDTDIDLCVIVDDIDPEKVVQDFKQYFTYAREVKRGEQIHQAAFQDDDLLIIDICFYYKHGKNYISYAEGGKWIDDDQIEWRDTKYGQFPFPKDIEAYLERRYGKNWIIPSSDKSIKQ